LPRTRDEPEARGRGREAEGSAQRLPFIRCISWASRSNARHSKAIGGADSSNPQPHRQMTTNTPRTDAIISAIDMDQAFQDLCRQLERELSHSLANQVKAQEKIEALRTEKNACLAGNKYYGDKAVVLQDKINRAIDVLMERIQNDQIEEQASNILKERNHTISS